MLDAYAVFSRHAHDRLKECQLSPSKAAWLLYTAEKETLPKDLKKYNRKKYKQRSLHYRNGSLIFTIIPAIDKRTNERIYLVLSVFDQRIGLGKQRKHG